MLALGGSSFAFAQATNENVSTSFGTTVGQLNGLNVGNLPAGIQTVVNNLTGYLNFEQDKNSNLVLTRDAAENDVTAQEQLISSQTTLINTLISANPLDPQIAVQQAVLDTLQADLVTRNTTLTNAQNDVTNSDIKISLYQQAINGPVAGAQLAASQAAAAITRARDQFASGGALTSPNANATGSAGLQNIINSIESVTAGDQTPVITAIQGADTTFQVTGADAASIADIQALVGSINTNLPTLPPISVADRDNALTAVLNGSYERNAIDNIQSNGIAGIVRRDPVTGAIHIGQNSLITNEDGGVQELYAKDAGNNPININVTNGSDLLVNGVSVATDADVAAEAATRAAADVALQNNIDAEATTRAASDVVLQNNINAEATTRAAADVVLQNNIDAEAATRAAADVTLQNNINAEATNRAAADVVLQSNIDAEAATRAAADTQLQTNINALDTRVTTEVARLDDRVNVLNTRVTTEVTRLDGRIDGLDARTGALEGRMRQSESDIRSLRKGIAMSAALQTPVINHGDKQAVKIGAATYDGEQGLGFGYARRVNDSVTVNVDVATGFPDTVARGGVNLSF